ncbi:MAG: hypothetical protein H6624_01620 [Bdellovibrionaceae bacterium]|nr:hypothetical protein [Bdellovibrionales bacterium]MCB9083006.1 hypothetical protein [Pseudobdellovibrionaceae bacterium]
MFRTGASLLALLFLVAGCGSLSIVNKPEAEKIKTVAIVSVYSNKVIYNRSPSSNGGALGGLMALKTLATDGVKAYENLEMKDPKIVNVGLKRFHSEFSKVGPWKVVPHTDVIKSAAYQKFTTKAPTTMKVKEGMINKTVNLKDEFIPAKGMVPFVVTHGSDEAVRAQLKQLAKELKVDAVAVVKLDVGYTPSTAVGNVGSAAAAAGADVMIVNRNGEFAVATAAHKKGEGTYETSDGTIAMAGNLAYSKELEELIINAIGKTATYYGKEINKNL